MGSEVIVTEWVCSSAVSTAVTTLPSPVWLMGELGLSCQLQVSVYEPDARLSPIRGPVESSGCL